MIMAERNSTLIKHPRSATAPELWIPYVMIGVSCVTFLAVHFWCYHKRNRERYLRKRDEKRVKSGLLERRRITTLMLARYQSDLGISQSETEVDLSQDVLFYDNNVEVFLDDSESQNGANRNQAFQNPADAATAAAPGLETHDSRNPMENASASSGPSVKALPNSHTWPRASARRSVSYNAHVGGCNQPDEAAGTHGDQRSTVVMDYNNSINIEPVEQPRRASEQQAKPMVVADPIPLPHLVSDVESGLVKVSQERPEILQTSAVSALKSSLPSATYPNVIYTSLDSPHNVKSTLFGPFRSNHKKRRHDGSPVEEAEDTHRGYNGMSNPFVNESAEIARAYGTEKDRVDPYTASSEGKHSVNYIYGNNDHYFCPIRSTDAPSSGIAEDEAFPFAGAGLAYGSIRHDSKCDNAQAIPLTEIKRGQFAQSRDGNFAQSLPARPDISTRAHDGPLYLVSSHDSTGVESSSNVDVEFVESNPQAQHGIHKNVVIAMPDRSPLNFISKTPRNIRVGGDRGDATKPWPPRPTPGVLTSVYTCQSPESDQEHQYFYSDHQHGHHDRPRTTVSQPQAAEQIRTQSVSAGVSVVKNIPASSDVDSDEAHDEHAMVAIMGDQHRLTQDGLVPAHSHAPLQTPSLRTLDPKLVFHHTKRKLTPVKPDQTKQSGT